jgi:two-component system nitrogen regulation response regulator GlnG
METDLDPKQAAAMASLTSFTEHLLVGGQKSIYRRITQAVDRAVLSAVLRHVNSNQSRASKILGISRTTLRSRLNAAGLSSDNQ